jgi:S-adenosylmethionine decarboxylase proenzyme
MSPEGAVGQHGIFVLRGVAPGALERIDEVRKRLWHVARDCDLNVVAESGHQFQPVGVTYVFVLAESHLSIHTYPERGNAYVDLFTCVLDFDMDQAVLALQRHFGEDGADAIEIDFTTIFR